jgi:hypothetical protein
MAERPKPKDRQIIAAERLGHHEATSALTAASNRKRLIQIISPDSFHS